MLVEKESSGWFQRKSGRMSRVEDWMRMRDRHLSEGLTWMKGGITTREQMEGKIGGSKDDHFHSGYVKFRVALRYPVSL